MKFTESNGPGDGWRATVNRTCSRVAGAALLAAIALAGFATERTAEQPVELAAAPGMAPDLPEEAEPSFLHVLTGHPLDLSPLPGETLTEAVHQFHRTGWNLYRDDADAVAEGRLLFREHCSFCHRNDGSGGNAPPIDGQSWVYSTTAEDSGMFSVIYGGGFGAMRSWRRHGMTQDQVLRITAYVRQLAVPGPLREEAQRATAVAAGGAGVH